MRLTVTYVKVEQIGSELHNVESGGDEHKQKHELELVGGGAQHEGEACCNNSEDRGTPSAGLLI